MQAMRYEITLPSDYDMDIIRKRVSDTGKLMDGFNDLLFKAYLITERDKGELSNSYSPLYIWKETSGMTEFLFSGYYDNILISFGWQNVEIGITSSVVRNDKFKNSKFVTEEIVDIPTSLSLKNTNLSEEISDVETAIIVIYNPDKWKKVIYKFYTIKPISNLKTYEILYISE